MGPQQNLVKDELEAGQGGRRRDAELEPFPQYMNVIEHDDADREDRRYLRCRAGQAEAEDDR